jgi:hypothetical protein
MYSLGSQSNLRATRISPNFPIFLGEDIIILQTNSQMDPMMMNMLPDVVIIIILSIERFYPAKLNLLVAIELY